MCLNHGEYSSIIVAEQRTKMALLLPEGSATARLGIRDFEIHWISHGFLDFKVDFWISHGFPDFKVDFYILDFV